MFVIIFNKKINCVYILRKNYILHRPKRKMRQDYLFFIYLKAMF